VSSDHSNYTNMLIWCTRSISYYYHCWRSL